MFDPWNNRVNNCSRSTGSSLSICSALSAGPVMGTSESGRIATCVTDYIASGSRQHVAQHLPVGDKRDGAVGAVGQSGFEIVTEEVIGGREQVFRRNGAIDDGAADRVGL